jgi:transglutaminase-like putative cysteine protease
VLRVRTAQRAEGQAAVPLLRTASYQHYAAGGWLARNHAFAPLRGSAHTWQIAAGAGGKVEIAAWLSEGRALLALPAGTYRLDALDVQYAERNMLAALRVAEGADPLFYRAWYDPRARTDAAPDADDLDVPAALAPALARITTELGPDGDPGRTVAGLQRFFATHFAYSLSLASEGQTRSLVRFLESDRRGHCEYFATATVLLLRQAGIPARYAVGYAVQEYSPLEGQYIARRRDAHAWALAWVNGRWMDVDTTPATWLAEESRDASLLQPIYDVFSWLNYRLAAWRTQGAGESHVLLVLLAGSPLLLLLLWRLYRLRTPGAPRRGRHARLAGPSPLQPVLDQLARRGYVRPAGMPLRRWVRDLPLADGELHRLLLEAVRLRYAQRFSESATAAQARELEEAVGRLRQRLRRG